MDTTLASRHLGDITLDKATTSEGYEPLVHIRSLIDLTSHTPNPPLNIIDQIESITSGNEWMHRITNQMIINQN